MRRKAVYRVACLECCSGIRIHTGFRPADEARLSTDEMHNAKEAKTVGLVKEIF